jgi:hypothetical protein
MQSSEIQSSTTFSQSPVFQKNSLLNCSSEKPIFQIKSTKQSSRVNTTKSNSRHQSTFQLLPPKIYGTFPSRASSTSINPEINIVLADILEQEFYNEKTDQIRQSVQDNVKHCFACNTRINNPEKHRNSIIHLQKTNDEA